MDRLECCRLAQLAFYIQLWILHRAREPRIKKPVSVPVPVRLHIPALDDAVPRLMEMKLCVIAKSVKPCLTRHVCTVGIAHVLALSSLCS